ncbi:MAG: polysaccharide deacetylase family protein [Longimicrobiales bacterium]|nr:polysaccharide deacetylase family protein [Longimicrobiales bacterium]
MARRGDPVPRARDAWVWLGGIAVVGVLAGGVLAAATLLWENVDVRQLAPVLAEAPPAPPLPEAPPPAAHPPVTFPAVLYRSPASAGFFPDSTYHAQALAGWRALAEGLGATVREAATPGELAGLEPGETLILVETPCLETEAWRAVRTHLSRGGGVLANWAVGARDGACRWRGWQPLRELTGAEDVRESEEREALFLTLPGGSPLSAGLDPGTRIEVRGEPSLALRASGTRVFWSDWALNPAPDESGGGADVAASVHRTPAGGRAAWVGPRLDQAATPMDSLRLDRMAGNALLWAAGVPTAAVSPWPGGHRAALVVALEVESEPRNALPVASRLERAGVPGTFFAVTGLVRDDPQLARALTGAGEVGSQTVDHTPLAGHTAREQVVRLRRSMTEVSEWSGVPAAGLRPPEEALDGHTVRAWVRAGGTYLLALNDARSAAPEVHTTPDGDAVLIPRLMKDDYNVFVQDGAVRAARLGEAWLEGTAKLRALGGLAAVAGHTQIMGVPARLDAMMAVLDTLRAQGDWWLATGGEVSSWWLDRHRVTMRWVRPDGVQSDEGSAASSPGSGVQGWELEVAAPAGGDTIRGLWVEVFLPGGFEGLIPWVGGLPSDHATANHGVRVPVGELPPGTARRISLRAAPPDAGS